MTAVLASLALKFWPYIVGALGLGLGAFRWRSSIIKSERARVAKQEAKARDISDEIDDAVAGRDPAKNREELRRW